jgi:AraC-like DNA-binding protein
MPDLIRAACLTHFSDVARAAGIDPDRMLTAAGIPRHGLSDPDIRIPGGAVRRLLEASAAAAGIDDFGLRLAMRGGLSNLGPVALVAREQPTVGAAMEALGRYIHIHNESLTLRLERHDDIVLILPHLRLGRPVPARQSAELVIGVTHRILAAFLGRDWRAREVRLASPAGRDQARYRRVFDTQVMFGAEFDVIVCRASDMEQPMATADAVMAHHAQDYVESIAARAPRFDGKVRDLVTALLPTGRCSLDQVSQHLGWDARTVQRRLADRGTSFSAIVDACRADLVARLIEDKDRSLPAVAQLLGFSAQSALARWFRDRFGCSITAWRAGRRPG